jgi:ribosomal protein L31
MMRRAAYALSLLLVSGFVYVAQAQLGTTDPLTVTINPDYPKPYQIVTVTPESTLFDLAASNITFSVNGQVVQRGTGSESASVAVGGPGSVTTITVTAVNNGQTYTRSVTIRPADVALIVEPTSTTHPFYEGASLVGSQGRLRLIAVPDLRTSAGVPIASSNLVYTWKNGEQILQSTSGIGKSVLTGTAPVRYRDTVITVTVSSQDGSVVGRASALISPRDPIVRIYENDPLLGPRFENALVSSAGLSEDEGTYRAVPYYFTSAPAITWEVNGNASQAGQDITVRPAGNGRGSAVLNVSASSGSIGQSASEALTLTFGRNSTGLFGF